MEKLSNFSKVIKLMNGQRKSFIDYLYCVEAFHNSFNTTHRKCNKFSTHRKTNYLSKVEPRGNIPKDEKKKQ